MQIHADRRDVRKIFDVRHLLDICDDRHSTGTSWTSWTARASRFEIAKLITQAGVTKSGNFADLLHVGKFTRAYWLVCTRSRPPTRT